MNPHDDPSSLFQVELDQEKGLEMRRWVLSGILTSEETYLSHLEALLIVCVSWRAEETVIATVVSVSVVRTGSTHGRLGEELMLES